MNVRFALLAIALPVAILIGLGVGGTTIAPHDVVAALAHPGEQTDRATIIWGLRLPRVMIAALLGAVLAIAGAIMQALLRNPLVDPYLTGVSAGAACAIALAVAAGLALPFIPAIGFAAGLATAVVVAILARAGAGLDPERLILAGVSLSALFSAFVTLILTAVTHGAASEMILAWLAGSLAGRGWSELIWTLPYSLAGIALAVMSIPALNVMRLGERRAAALGVDLARVQWTVLAAAALLAACGVALGGMVGFVGLIVPHLGRRLVGGDLRRLVPACALTGATLVVLADAASRALAPPVEIPLGVLLAVIGVPVFLYLYLHGQARAYA